MGQQKMETQLDQTSFEALVASEVDGQIGADDLSALTAQPQRWAATLHHILEEIEDTLEVLARSDRYERDQALADLSDERAAVAAALRRVTGEDVDLPDPATLGDGDEAAMAPSGEAEAELVQAPALQASWAPGEVVLWAGNPSATPAGGEDLQRLIDEAGGSAIEWEKHKGVPLPSGDRAPAVSAPVTAALGWLVGVGAGQLALDAGPSVRWLGEVAAWATDLVAQGRMVPTLRRGGSATGRGRQRSGSYVVQWIAAVVERERIRELSARMPGPVRAFDPSTGPERLCRTVLNAAVDAVCRGGCGPFGHGRHTAGGA